MTDRMTRANAARRLRKIEEELQDVLRRMPAAFTEESMSTYPYLDGDISEAIRRVNVAAQTLEQCR